eukprot:CAMPEP_0167747522 /NCGR_PEP_ID=MMETSP0110_2-20121227/4331_1 /TAXON_ID=629695 /ORGANISM="Gymnochlora sp., Strain CCMP2014" /LENGTH=351 /DNA_ID=CAMNT_0007632439 /DNA_START=115 /DNA_END=1167 /DNA_ORIENTATION=-
MASSRRQVIGAGSVASLGGVAGKLSRVARADEMAPIVPANTNLKIPDIGIGTWAWGDPLFWNYEKSQDPELRQVYDYCMQNGVTFWDTAELYGFGRSEQLLGKFSRESNTQPTIATKFAALPFRSRESVVKACKGSLERLGVSQIDLYQIHFPNAYGNKAFWDGIADCYDKGLIKAVGVSNYGVEALTATNKALKERGVPLTSNQIQYSLLYRFPETNGLLKACDDMDVKVLAYSPLFLGFLVGKYTLDHLPKGPRSAIGAKLLRDPEYKNLLSTMDAVAANHDATKPQVAIAWCIAKGTCPIPGARNLRQAKENVAAAKIILSPEEVLLLDTAASKVSPVIYPDVNPFPK